MKKNSKTFVYELIFLSSNKDFDFVNNNMPIDNKQESEISFTGAFAVALAERMSI